MLAVVGCVAAVQLQQGCAVVYPPGWSQRVEPAEVIRPTPWVMYGFAPVSWDLPNHERILITARGASVLKGMGLYHAEADFTATYAATGDAIRCASEPSGPDVPRTRFGCWSVGGTGELSFWLAPDEDCPPRHVAQVKTLTTPQCWQGELAAGRERAELHHGYLEATGSPLGYLSWSAADDQPLLAAEIGGGAIRLFDVDRGARSTARLRRWLVLVTVALHWWEELALHAE